MHISQASAQLAYDRKGQQPFFWDGSAAVVFACDTSDTFGMQKSQQFIWLGYNDTHYYTNI